MNIVIRAKKIDLDSDTKDYINEKMSSLEKYFNNIIDIKVDVGLDSTHHQKGEIFFCEVDIRVPGDIIVVNKQAKTLFKAIDKTKDHLRVTLHRLKEKTQGRNRKTNKEDESLESGMEIIE